MEVKEKRIIKEKGLLFGYLTEIINEHYGNRGMIKEITKEFREKNLPSKTPNLVFQGDMSLDQLSDLELIGICRALYKDFEIEGVKPESYFTDSELYNYMTYMNIEEEDTELVFDRCIMNPSPLKGGMSYLASFQPLEKIARMYEQRLLRYNFATQRQATYKKIGKNTIKTMTINQNSVDDMSQLMCNNSFPENTITLNVLMIEGKNPGIYYDEEKCRLIIKPDFDINSDSLNYIDTIDGQHRILAACDAVREMKNKNKLNELRGSLHVSIQFFTLEQAKEYIRMQQLQNSFNKSYTRTLKNDDYMKFAKLIAEEGDSNSNVLFDKVANTFEEVSILDKYTEYAIIADALKQSGTINVSSPSEQTFKPKKISDLITVYVEYVLDNKFDNDIETMKNSAYLKPYAFAMYTMIAERLINEKNMRSKLLKIADLLIKNEDEINNLNLGRRECSLKKIENFLNSNIFTE